MELAETALSTAAVYAKGFDTCWLLRVPPPRIIVLAARLFATVVIYEPNRSVCAMARAILHGGWIPTGSECKEEVDSREAGFVRWCAEHKSAEREWAAAAKTVAAANVQIYWGESLPAPASSSKHCIVLCDEVLPPHNDSVPVFVWRKQTSSDTGGQALRLVGATKRETKQMELVTSTDWAARVKSITIVPQTAAETGHYPGIHNSKPAPLTLFTQKKVDAFFVKPT